MRSINLVMSLMPLAVTLAASSRCRAPQKRHTGQSVSLVCQATKTLDVLKMTENKLSIVLLASVASIILLDNIGYALTSQSGDISAQSPVYFRIQEPNPKNSFVIELTDPAKIATARAIASGLQKKQVHVEGDLVKTQVFYNKPWHFHLDPASIKFFQIGPRICDRSSTWLQAHLAQAPKTWCPWGSRVAKEIAPPKG